MRWRQDPSLRATQPRIALWGVVITGGRNSSMLVSGGTSSSTHAEQRPPSSKQGNSLLRFLLVEAAQVAVRCDLEWRRQFVRLAMRRQHPIAMVAMARKLAVRLYWMWRKEWDHQQSSKFGSHAGQLGSNHGV